MDEFKPKRILMIGSPDDADPVFSVTNQVYREGPRHRAPETFAQRNPGSGAGFTMQLFDEGRWIDVGGIRDVQFTPEPEPEPQAPWFDGEAWHFAMGIIHGRGAHYGHGGKRMTAFGVEVCVTCGGQR